ncbi:MAG TPA: MarR family transcriptional regulator [Stellaceae bacterium]|jgi:DNA-binding MarR family transcriptional regulator|nr:MarR family transcriptional regulator [Stellaceae bacterium]
MSQGSNYLPRRSANAGAHSEAGAAFTQLVIEVFRLNGAMVAVGDELTRDLGLTTARWQVLGAIGNEPKTVAAAARLMGLTRQNVQRIADWLVESGIAEFVDNPNHRRAKLVALTKEGAALRQQLGRRQARWANASGASFTADELRATMDILKRLKRALEKHSP